MALDFRVLGPLEVVGDGHPLVVSSAKQRLMLAVLLSHANDVVSVDSLVEGLWSGRAPTTALGVVRSYVSALRKVLETPGTIPARPRVLLRAEGGYRLVVPADLFDAAQFGRLHRAGRAALNEGRPADAIGLLSAGLALWRGRAFGDLALEAAIQPAAQRLQELHTLTIEHRADAGMALGHHREIIGELETVLSEYPLRERLWAQLMVCLYRSGRQAEALGAYQRLRRQLGEELGLEPSVELRRLESDILQQSPQLDWVSPTAPSGAASPEVGTTPTNLDLAAHSHDSDSRDWPGAPRVASAFVSSSAPGNLGVTPSEGLVGRAEETAAVVSLVQANALVTLTGVGGVGKTSLALAAGHVVAATFGDGVWVCELASVLDGKDVAQAVAETLRLRPQNAMSQQELVVSALAHQHCLLLLDNCEHLLDAVGDLLAQLLASCPQVRVLATSREGIGCRGERLVAVKPLDAPAAVALFRLRIAEHVGGFEISDADEATVAVLCERLDGVPLAIELAAARARTMPLADLTRRLDERFRLLRGQRRATERHQTLRATVAWSYDLLSDNERRLFDRLSVFVGGFTLQAAEFVCADEELDDIEVDEIVASLADKSMVGIGPGGRYVSLETLRQFGGERLQASDDPTRFRQAHLRFFVDLVVAGHDGLFGADQLAWWARLQADWANIRAAFSWALANNDLTAAATIATQLLSAAHWHDAAEPFVWIDTVGALAGAADSELCPSILAGRAIAAWNRGELQTARDLGLAAIAAEAPGEANIDYFAEFAVGAALAFLGPSELPLAGVYWDRMLQRSRDDGRLTLEAMFTANQATFATMSRNYPLALQRARQARVLAGRCQNPNAEAYALAQEAIARFAVGDGDALEVAERGLSAAVAAGAVLPELLCGRTVATIYRRSGRTAEAARLMLDLLQNMRRRGRWMWVGQSLVYAAPIMIPTHPELAARLYGAIRHSSLAGSANMTRLLDELRAELQLTLKAQTLHRLAEEGCHQPIEALTRLAEQTLAALGSGHEPGKAGSAPPEKQVRHTAGAGHGLEVEPVCQVLR